MKRGIDQTEQTARKHGQATNQRSSFKYLMKDKTHRSVKSVSQKQNHDSSTVTQLIKKYVQPFPQNKNYIENKNQQKLNLPLTSCQKNTSHKRYQTVPSEDHTNLEIDQSDFLNRFNKNGVDEPVIEYQEQTSIVNDLEITQKNYDAYCMTEECYYIKELQIKISALQKQRDDMWQSISGIVKQNMTLKEIMATLTIETSTKISSESQTNVQQIDEEISTDMNWQSIEEVRLQLQKANEYITETIQFCKLLCFEDDSYLQFEWNNLKDAVCQCVNSKVTGAYNQFESESEVIKKIKEQGQLYFKQTKCQYQQTINKRQLNIQSLTNTIQKLEETLLMKQQMYTEQIKQLRNNVISNQKNYQKTIEQYKQIQQQKQKQMQTEIQLAKQLFEVHRTGWQEKQKIYSTLLSESHKTINNLTTQMRQFEILANSNYGKSLRYERNLNGFHNTHHQEQH